MKNIIKIASILLLAITFNCSTSDGRFKDEPTSGWLEFRTAATTTGQTATSVTLPLTVNVPVYQNGLNVSYNLVAVEGDFTQFVTSSSGTVYASPDDTTRALSIVIDLINTEAGRNFVTSFDVVLTGVDVSSVGIGVDEDSIIKHRITIPCSNPEVIPADYFVGSYNIQDVVGAIGPGNGTSNFQGGTVNLTVDPANPNRRNFSVRILPAFIATPYNVSIDFTTDNVIALNTVTTTIGCSAPRYAYGTAGANNTAWDVCNDQSVVVNYIEDINSSCGGPYPASFRLTKL